MARVVFLVSSMVAAGCGSGALGGEDGGSTGGSSGAPTTTLVLESSDGTTTTGDADDGTRTSGSETELPTASGSTLAPDTDGGRATTTGSSTATTTGSSSATSTSETSTGMDSTSSGSSSSSGEPALVESENTAADLEWVTPLVGIAIPPDVRSWNGSPTVVVSTDADADLVVAVGLPTQTTIETSGSSIAGVVVLDEASGSLVSTQVLFETSTPEIESSQFTSAVVTDVAIDQSGALIVAGGWTGTTTFFPGTPDATTRTTLAIGVTHPGEPEQIDVRFDSAVLRIEPDGSTGWLAVSELAPDAPDGGVYDYPRSVVILDNGDPLVAGSWLSQGTSFPAGHPDAYVSTGNESFFIRLDQMTGAPVWTGLGGTGVHGGFSDAVGLATYVVLEGKNGPEGTGSDGVYFEDTPNSITLPFGRHIARLNPGSGVPWAVLSTHEEFGGVRAIAARADDRVAVVGYSGGGTMTLEGSDGATTTTTLADVFSPRAHWLSWIDAEGSVLVLRPLPIELRFGRPADENRAKAILTDDAGVWIGGFVLDSAWFHDDDAPLFGSLDRPAVLIHITDDGFVDQTRVLGVRFGVESLAWADDTQTRLLVSGSFRNSDEPALIVSGGTELEPLLGDCVDVCAPGERGGFVASINLGG